MSTKHSNTSPLVVVKCLRRPALPAASRGSGQSSSADHDHLLLHGEWHHASCITPGSFRKFMRGRMELCLERCGMRSVSGHRQFGNAMTRNRVQQHPLRMLARPPTPRPSVYIHGQVVVSSTFYCRSQLCTRWCARAAHQGRSHYCESAL
jgi:hypothetical protein